MGKRFISCLIVFIMVFGLNTPFSEAVYAAESFSFNWERDMDISDIIEIPNRQQTENELVLSWSYDKIIGGTDAYKGEYLLKYNLVNGEQVELKMNNSNDTKAVFEYRVKDKDGNYKVLPIKAYDNIKSNLYYAYNYDGKFWANESNSTDKWENNLVDGKPEHPEHVFGPTGVTIEMIEKQGPNITVDKGSTVVFKYDNKLVVINMDEAGKTIRFGIDSIERGKIYNFDMSCERDGLKYSDSMNIFKLVEFKTIPFADPDKIDKRISGNEGLYAGKDPAMIVKVALPSIWNENEFKFVSDPENPYSEDGYRGMMAVVNLKSNQTGETIQVNIPDIYDENKKPYITESSNTKAVFDDEYGVKLEEQNYKKYLTFKLKGMESSTLYSIANIGVEALSDGSTSNESKLQTVTCGLEKGENAYTYLEYNTETKGTGERILSIKPYAVNGTYYIYQATTEGALSGEESIIATIPYATSSGKDMLEMPVSNDAEYYYMVEFRYELGNIKSQIIIDAADKSDYLKTPKLELKDFEVINRTEGDKQKQILKLKLSWNGGKQKTIDNLLKGGPITYTFKKTPFGPREDDSRWAEFLKVTVEDGYNLKATAGNWDTLVKLDGKGTPKYTSTADGEEVYELIFNMDLEFELLKEDDIASRDEPSKVFYYPSVYYIKMNVSYTNSIGEEKETPYCNPASITLDSSSNTVLSPPQSVAANTPTISSFNLNWATVTDSVYGEFLKANDYELQLENGTAVNIFLTQQNILNEEDEQKQKDYFDYKDGNNENMVSVPYERVVTDVKDGIITLDVSSVISDIRNNKMIRITNVPQIIDKKAPLAIQTVKLIGLDRNTAYYSALQTVLNVVSKADGSKKQEVSEKVSQIVTITTLKEDPLNPPQPEEIPPNAPTDFRQDSEVEQLPTKITMAWTDVKEPQSIDGVKVKREYEIIRVSKKLDNSILSKRNSFDNFWANDLNSSEYEKVGWQTLSSEAQPDNLLIYNNSDFVKDSTNTGEKYLYDDSDKSKLQFIDKTMMPNRLYYYYIRTVRMKETSNGTYTESSWSSWIPASVTTEPIKAPIGLKQERNNTYFSYDTETEVVISFFAPIPAGTTFEQIASLYPLEYAIMKENGEWEIVSMDITNSSRFKAGNEKKEGYQQYVYKITGLEQGKGYHLKVRMKSRVNPITEATPVYDVSLYSNTIDFRTDTNQDIIDNNEALNKWLNLFDEELIALSAKPYWILTNTDRDYEALYRTKTFEGELQKAASGAYSFEAENQPNQTYYIPADSITMSDSSNIGFKAFKDNMDVIFRAGSFDLSSSEDILDAVNRIKDGDAKDYYIQIDLSWDGTNEAINNSDPLSERMEVIVSVIGSKEVEKNLDKKYVQMFKDATSDDSKTAKVRNDLKKDLEKAIKRGDTNEELYEMVMDAVNEAYDDLVDDIEKDFRKNKKGDRSVDLLAENMLISASVNAQSSVSGYRKNNTSWETMDTRDYGGKKGFETSFLGIFIFAGKNINIPDITGIPNSSAVTNIIAKYGLDEYLGRDIIDTKSKATKYMVAGCIAKIAGAETSQNPTAFLKSKGVNITSGRMYDDIKNQEAVYLLMALYQIKTGTDISTVRITDYTAMPKLAEADDNYKKSLQVAMQLGICTDTSIAPKDTISIRDFLKYIGNMSTKIAL